MENTTINQMKQSFQDGVDSIYNALVGQGTTPSGKTPADLVAGIGSIGGKVSDEIGGYAEEYHVGAESTVIQNPALIAPKGSYVISFCLKTANYGVPQPEHGELIRNVRYNIARDADLEFKIFKVTEDSAMSFNAVGYNYTQGAFIIK